MTSSVGIGVVGLGWMGQAHSRSYRRIPMHFPELGVAPELVVAADINPERAAAAQERLGFAQATTDWREAIDHPGVDAVVIAAPNKAHREIAEAAAAAGKAIFCEKPVGDAPEATAAIERAAREAGVVTGAGYNYRWAPMVQHLKGLVSEGRLGEITHYRGRFFTMYGRDRLGALSWRYSQEEAGYGALTDIMSHAIDMAHNLAGPISRVVSVKEIFVKERPLPRPGAGTHYDRGAPGDPTGEVTNEDYVAALVEFESGARGTLEADRSIFGPQSEMAFELNGSRGAAAWSLETMNELQLHLPEESPADGYIRVLSGEAFPHHGSIVPGGGNPIGYEDLKLIEALEFLRSVASGEQGPVGLADALAVAEVESAMTRSWASGRWEAVTALTTDREKETR